MGIWTIPCDRPEDVADLPGRWRPLYAPDDDAVVVAGRDEDGDTTAVMRVEYVSAEGLLDARLDVAHVVADVLTRVVQDARRRHDEQLFRRPI